MVVSHVIALGGYGGIPNGINQSSFGQLAVYGFFGISGFLIAGSAMRNSTGRYLWQRCLRIFPAFWFCLIVTAFGIGVVAWVTHSPSSCGLSCYFSAHDGPWSYLTRNGLLEMNQYSIAGTPHGGPASGVWDGPLWTLEYEFLCYLLLGALALVGLLRRPAVCLTLLCTLWVTILVITVVPAWDSQFNVFSNDFAMNLIRFATVFLAGACLCLYQDRVPDSGWLALVLSVVFVGSLFLPTRGQMPDFAFTLPGILVPLVAYPVLWLGRHLPLQRVGARNDYSYGTYIFGFAVTQLLLLWGVARWGFVPLAALTVIGTGLFAAASWWLVERHALRMKGISVPALRGVKARLSGAGAIADSAPEHDVPPNGGWQASGSARTDATEQADATPTVS